MGTKHSKENINEDLKKLGENEIKKENTNEQVKPNEESTQSKNIVNNFIIISNSSEPKKDYNIIQTLKKGSYSNIILVENKISKMRSIMKTIKKTKYFTNEEDKLLNNDLKILSILDHPNIIKVFAFYSNPSSYSYITEFCQEGDLSEQLLNKGVYNEIQTAYIMHQIFSAVNYCHKNKIINRGLALENILVSEIRDNMPTVKIGYFGTSILADKNAIEIENKNESFYLPPEAIGYKNKYSEKSDIWSCGVIMYFLLSARPPFIGKDEEEKNNNILKEKFDLEKSPFDTISQECKDLLKLLLKSNPDERPSAADVLKNPWFIKKSSKLLFTHISREKIIRKILNNIKTYKNVSIFQKYALNYLIHNFPQLNDVKNSAKLFYQIDLDSDGKISKDELFNGLNEQLENKITKEEFEEIYKNIDLNNSGFIDYEEFVVASVTKNIFMRDNILSTAFKFFDKDNSGEITFDEIEMMFKEAVNDGKTDVHQALKKILDEIDVNIDGKINFEEFANFMKQLIK